MSMPLSFVVGMATIMKVFEIRLHNTFQDRKRVEPSKYILVRGGIRILRNGVEAVGTFIYFSFIMSLNLIYLLLFVKVVEASFALFETHLGREIEGQTQFFKQVLEHLEHRIQAGLFLTLVSANLTSQQRHQSGYHFYPRLVETRYGISIKFDGDRGVPYRPLSAA